MPRVSVVLCVHNEQRFVAEAVGSVLGQTFADFELLVIDDRSDDRTPEILAGFTDARLRVVRNDTPRQLYDLAAWGVAETTGDYVARMDGDDVSEPERLAAEVAFLDANPDVVAVGTYATMIDADGHPLPPESRWNTVQAQTEAADAHDQRDDLWRGRMHIVNGSSMFRRTAYEAAGGYDPDINLADRDLYLRLAEIGRVALIPRPLYRWRHYPQHDLKWNRRHELENRLPLTWKFSRFHDADPENTHLNYCLSLVRDMNFEKDYWRLAAIRQTDTQARMAEILADCRARGETRLALYHDGRLTEQILDFPCVRDSESPRIIAILGDNPGRGRLLAGVPLVDVAGLREAQVDALVLCSYRIEWDLHCRAVYGFDLGNVRVISFFGRPDENGK